MQRHAEIFVYAGVLVGALIYLSTQLPYYWFTDEVQHLLGGIGIAFITIGVARILNVTMETTSFIIAVLIIALVWEFWELAAWGGRGGSGMMFIEDTILDIALGVIGAFVVKDYFSLPEKQYIEWVDGW